MKSFLGFAVICLVTIFVQASADHSSHTRGLNVVRKNLATCDLKGILSKFDELVTSGVYSLADVVISMEGSLYDTVTCADSGFLAFWSCSYKVWAEEFTSIHENVTTYYATVQDLITDIIQELLTCVSM